MKTKKYAVISILTITILFFSFLATASMLIPANDKAKENSKAPENSPVIGENWDLERVDFIHFAKPSGISRPQKTETCYKLMGVKWNTLPVNYAINPTNNQGLTSEFITSAISTSAETWDSAISKELFNDQYTVNSNVNYGYQDFVNAVDLGDYPDGRVIAVTSVWYRRIGKQIVEFDMRFNTRFNWGNALADPSKMDLQNIATHELGHGIGLDDIYSSSCSEVTMYGYSTEGETKRTTLEQPDIIGLQKMYGL